jgi:hypothetical protein
VERRLPQEDNGNNPFPQMEFLKTIEESGFCQWVREADSLFAFPGILLLHTIGMGLVVGINATFDLRVLGFAPLVSLRAYQRFFPVMWLGFWINAATGTILLAVNATKLTHNPDFYVKLVFIALAVINLQLLRRQVFHPENPAPSTRARILAVTSMIFWIGAIISGRLLAYVGHSIGVL